MVVCGGGGMSQPTSIQPHLTYITSPQHNGMIVARRALTRWTTAASWKAQSVVVATSCSSPSALRHRSCDQPKEYTRDWTHFEEGSFVPQDDLHRESTPPKGAQRSRLQHCGGSTANERGSINQTALASTHRDTHTSGGRRGTDSVAPTQHLALLSLSLFS
jgi:hypothetical protein